MEKKINKVVVILVFGVALVIFLVVLVFRNYFNSKEDFGISSSSGTTNNSKAMNLGFHDNLTGKKLFEEHCISCHEIGSRDGGLILRKLQTIHSKEWLYEFIRNPKKLMDANDKYALKLKEEYGGMIMPSYEFLSESQIDSMLAHIEFVMDK